ncbi:MAG TPA: carboxypeptidase-like regulatory domain-containing protein, partial [Terriglobales bacterium]|nr:carboxypeptidase-like regulatory domain-containing protein [Terriglobales bacterium]
MTSRTFFQSALLLLFVSLTFSSAHAQYRASIQGVITDQQGAIVQDANVNLTNKETNQTATTTSNAAGVYSFNALPPSRYSMTVEKTGFKKKVLDNVGVIAEQANSVNVQIDIGQTSETVTVQGDATPLIDTETANVSGTVTAQ